jgi:hypothetical protein
MFDNNIVVCVAFSCKISMCSVMKRMYTHRNNNLKDCWVLIQLDKNK